MHLVNPTAEGEAEVRSLVFLGEVTAEHRELSSDEEAAHASNSRVRITRELLERGFPFVVNMDADAIVRRDAGSRRRCEAGGAAMT